VGQFTSDSNPVGGIQDMDCFMLEVAERGSRFPHDVLKGRVPHCTRRVERRKDSLRHSHQVRAKSGFNFWSPVRVALALVGSENRIIPLVTPPPLFNHHGLPRLTRVEPLVMTCGALQIAADEQAQLPSESIIPRVADGCVRGVTFCVLTVNSLHGPPADAEDRRGRARVVESINGGT
jgi:hypothetical protein